MGAAEVSRLCNFTFFRSHLSEGKNTQSKYYQHVMTIKKTSDEIAYMLFSPQYVFHTYSTGHRTSHMSRAQGP